MTTEVLLERRGPLGLVTLNRPKALNALDLGMIRALHPALEAWAREPEVKAVVIRGAGGRAFCAGGDVRAVAASLGSPVPEGQEPLSRAFFREEYRLNQLIHHHPKPYVALVDGICMGGGLGLSVHGSHRVVTERLVLAMPETGIGLFPDVGGGWFLPRFAGEAGTYLGLTGARCNAADAMWLGYGTQHVTHDKLEAVVDALAAADWAQGPAKDVATRVLEGFTTEPGPSPLKEHREEIDRCFAKDRVEEILAALEAEGTPWAGETRATLGRMSPSSLKVTLRQLRLCRGLPYDEVVTVEYRLSQRTTALPDFREGIRAVLVDKDNRPRWNPPTLAEVREADVEACFAPEPVTAAPKPPPLVIHPHFHRRRTGVTAHTELIVPELARLMETRALGKHLAGDVPRIEWGELWRRIREEPVVWHAHRNNELLFGFLLRLLGKQVRLVYTRHGPYAPSWFTRFIARYAEQLVTLNPQGAEWMGIPSQIVTHGVDLGRFVPPVDRAAAWQGLGLGGRYGVGVVGRVRPNKGQGDFVEAIRPLLSQFPEWKPVLVGLAKDKDVAWAEKLRASTEGTLVLAGEQRNVVPWYQGLSILVHPSYGEAFSMVLVEAMACGSCPVVTRLPHVPAVIEHGRTGFMYEPGDVPALRELLTMLLREPERAHQVGRNASEEARARFGVGHEARALAQVYQAALEE